MWKINVPSRIHIFLWLLANNKTLTRDNLAKRKHVDDTSCLFCNEKESVSHLFFECYVAKLFWSWIVEITCTPIGADFESVAKCYLSEKRFSMLNCFLQLFYGRYGNYAIICAFRSISGRT
jgi:hypothetical protein